MKPSDLILLISKLNSAERASLKESRDETGYALNSSINKKKTMFNTFDSSMQTLQSQQWYANSTPSNKNDIISLILPKIPLSRYCQNKYAPQSPDPGSVSKIIHLNTLLTVSLKITLACMRTCLFSRIINCQQRSNNRAITTQSSERISS